MSYDDHKRAELRSKKMLSPEPPRQRGWVTRIISGAIILVLAVFLFAAVIYWAFPQSVP